MKSASLLRVVLTLLSVLAIAQPVAAAPGDTIFTHPGKIVSVGGRGLKSRQHLPGDDRPFVCNRIFFRRMPDPIFSPALNAYIERVSKAQIPLWDEVISEEEQMPADERYLKTHIHRMGSKPLFVLTALEHFGDPLHLTAARRVKAKRFEGKKCARASPVAQTLEQFETTLRARERPLHRIRRPGPRRTLRRGGSERSARGAIKRSFSAKLRGPRLRAFTGRS